MSKPLASKLYPGAVYTPVKPSPVTRQPSPSPVKPSNLSLSDVDLRTALFDALRAIEPGFHDIVEVFPDEGRVIYVTMPESEPLLWQRSFTVDGENVTLNEPAVRVEPTTSYEPVTASEAKAMSDPYVLDVRRDVTMCITSDSIRQYLTREDLHRLAELDRPLLRDMARKAERDMDDRVRAFEDGGKYIPPPDSYNISRALEVLGKSSTSSVNRQPPPLDSWGLNVTG